ncbi:hypothetical protein BGX21_004847 [Mortierella sp. AD011]|nr:hypothetical protein BGX20_003721 [Mortierella sp. AD010]KAF9372251.1 hypothetical protein BGX21_004847 [Mortierella sp. AD011]
MIPKPSQTRITGMGIFPNVLFGLSSSRPFTEFTGSSCITGTRGDLNSNDDEGNSGTCGHDDKFERTEGSYDNWYEGIDEDVEKGLSETEDELRDAVDYIRRRMNALTEGFAYYSWVDDTDDINPSYWDCPDDMVKPLLKQKDYKRMRSLFMSRNSILRSYGLSDSEYSDLTCGRELRCSEESLWLDNDQVKKRIELWKQERQQK